MNLYQAGAALHRSLYRSGVLPTVRLPVPVVAVGNLAFGGSGKTLWTEYIARKIQSKIFNHRDHGETQSFSMSSVSSVVKMGVVCRSYGAQPGPHLVDRNCEPAEVGDEAVLLAEKLAGVAAVASGASKTDTAQMLIARRPDVRVIVIDDAFQHHRLHRDLNILLWHRPDSLLRESPAALKYADILCVPNGQRSPLPEEKTVFFVKELIAISNQQSAVSQNVAISSQQSAVSQSEAVSSQRSAFFQTSVAESCKLIADSSRVLGVAGIAAQSVPGFEKMLRQCAPRAEFIRFDDHCDYADPANRARLLHAARGMDAIITTEKDAVKLRVLELPPIHTLNVRIRVLTNEHLLDEALNRILEHSARSGQLTANDLADR